MNCQPSHPDKRRQRQGSLDLFQPLLGGGSERSNAWMERCKILVKNYERTLANATTKLNFCFVRLMIKRLAAS
ncbi:MAG: transposase [Gloeocapsa sp. UFS-A4-WI-NPMV-4B04]|nr:transposase [Gloeocapsa sp. UFS-A4-WI-NPMV-4B04]